MEEEEEYDNAYLWQDPFLERHNLEIEILDGGDLEMVQVAEECFRMNVEVADEGSILGVPLPEGFGSIPHTEGSGQTSNTSFLDRFDLVVNQMFETKEEL